MHRESVYNQGLAQSFLSRMNVSKLTQAQSLIFTLFGWIPLSLGRVLRCLTYRQVLGHIGTSVQIDSGVEFVCAEGIHLEDWVKLERDVRIRCYGKDSQVKIKCSSRLDRGVDIKTHGSGKIQIGSNTYIGPYTCLSGDSIKIGENCLIASHSAIYANNHIFDDPTYPIRKQGNSYKGISIEDDCWLGSGVRVLDGVTIGRGSVVGAGAVVTKNIPPYSVAVGVPAKVISKRQ
jgi:acetyltransferase-like isoleucine patch superfamily enzyme